MSCGLYHFVSMFYRNKSHSVHDSKEDITIYQWLYKRMIYRTLVKQFLFGLFTLFLSAIIALMAHTSVNMGDIDHTPIILLGPLSLFLMVMSIRGEIVITVSRNDWVDLSIFPESRMY